MSACWVFQYSVFSSTSSASLYLVMEVHMAIHMELMVTHTGAIHMVTRMEHIVTDMIMVTHTITATVTVILMIMATRTATLMVIPMANIRLERWQLCRVRFFTFR